MKIERIVYFGTAEIAVPALEALRAEPGCEVVAVCTQPDRPSGRKRRLTPSPVKVKAEELNLPVLDPEQISEARAELERLDPDLAVVFAYGQYMPESVFDLPTYGSVNFHPSLLPAYRGASPIQSAIADGCTESGLTVLRVSKRMDAGDLLMQRVVSIGGEDTAETMRRRFADLAAELVPDMLRGLREGTLRAEPQDEEEATECGRLQKSDGEVDWTAPARETSNKVRAYQPWPGVFFPLGDAGNVKILRVRVEAATGTPGEVLEAEGEGPLVACGRNAVRLLEVQPPGKKSMSGRDFLNGHRLRPGDRFSSASKDV